MECFGFIFVDRVVPDVAEVYDGLVRLKGSKYFPQEFKHDASWSS